MSSYLVTKARTHSVRNLGFAQYAVTSGSSGKVYDVDFSDKAAPSCNCTWGSIHRAPYDPRCSHVLAVDAHRQRGAGWLGRHAAAVAAGTTTLTVTASREAIARLVSVVMEYGLECKITYNGGNQ